MNKQRKQFGRLMIVCMIVCLSLMVWVSPAATPEPSPHSGFPWSRSRQQDKAGFYAQPAGLCEDYPREDRTQAKLDRDFAVMRRANVRLLRVGIPWESIEPERGQYHWSFWDRLVATAVRNHVTLIPYVCYTPEWAASQQESFWKQPPDDAAHFGKFMRVIAARYRGRVHSWELWNEPDNPDFWLGDASDYARLVRAGAQGVRLADSSNAVALGGLADGGSAFARTLFEQQRIDRVVDAVNVHGYNETWNRNSLEEYPRQIADLSDGMAADARHLDLWMAEFGYSNLQPSTNGSLGEGPTVYDYQHTAAYQASALFKSHVLALSTGQLSLTAWYRINDLPASTQVIGDAENRFLGVMDVQGRPKPAFFALKFYNTLFGLPVRCLDDTVQTKLPPKSQSSLHVFEQKNGKIIVVGWLRSPEPSAALSAQIGARDTRTEEVSLILPAGVSAPVAAYNLRGSQIPTPARLTGRRLDHVVLTGAQPFIAVVSLPQKAARRSSPHKSLFLSTK